MIDQLVKEAIKKYPKGTKFISLADGRYEVVADEYWQTDKDGYIWFNGQGGNIGIVYDDKTKKWAYVLERPNKKFLDVEDLKVGQDYHCESDFGFCVFRMTAQTEQKEDIITVSVAISDMEDLQPVFIKEPMVLDFTQCKCRVADRSESEWLRESVTAGKLADAGGMIVLKSMLVEGQIYQANYSGSEYVIKWQEQGAKCKYMSVDGNSYNPSGNFNQLSGCNFYTAKASQKSWLEACISAGRAVREPKGFEVAEIKVKKPAILGWKDLEKDCIYTTIDSNPGYTFIFNDVHDTSTTEFIYPPSKAYSKGNLVAAFGKYREAAADEIQWLMACKKENKFVPQPVVEIPRGYFQGVSLGDPDLKWIFKEMAGPGPAIKVYGSLKEFHGAVDFKDCSLTITPAKDDDISWLESCIHSKGLEPKWKDMGRIFKQQHTGICYKFDYMTAGDVYLHNMNEGSTFKYGKLAEFEQSKTEGIFKEVY